jgi:hypothetical protein
MSRLLQVILLCLLSTWGFAENADATNWQARLKFHAETAYGPWSLAGSAAYAGILQEFDYPREWGQGAAGYGRRLGSTLAYSGVRNAMGFGLDTALRQDPRYYRSLEKGFWRRVGHAIRGTVLTRTDSGKETFSTWRVGSAYGATFISNEWYPERLNTVKLGLTQGTAQLGFDLIGNLGREFLPDLKKKIFHH